MGLARLGATPADEAELTKFARDARVEAILCTHKDLVKLRVRELGSIPLWAVTIEMRFLAAAVVPPIVLLADPLSTTPLALGTLAVPLAFVPMKFPWTSVALLLLVSSIPAPPLPEIIFRAASAVPPIVLLLIFRGGNEDLIRIPSPPFGTAAVPA